jgi:hypothetical protein
LEQLPQIIGELILQIASNGGPPPVHVAAIAINGSMLYRRYRVSDDGKTVALDELARFINKDGGFPLPIHLMLVDAAGEVYRAVISTEGKARLLH